MIRYENLIFDKLQGNTPKEKYEYLLKLIENETELKILLNRMENYNNQISLIDNNATIGNVRNFLKI